jgi:hypothetical protein
MIIEKLKPILAGIIKHIPGVKKILPKSISSALDSRYCYSVWMRHLINHNTFNNRIPANVLEFGPGDSLGTGLAALLSGSEHFYALDVVKYWDNNENLKIFEELIDLFKNKVNIPDNSEFPNLNPQIRNYSFPSNILSDSILNKTLDENRLNTIRKELLDIDNPLNSFIKYYIPWNSTDIIKAKSIDFIYSQAVLQHVEDLDNSFYAMGKWLKPSGLMSHTVDFKSMGVTKSWNGHWAFNDLEWEIVRGGKPFLINRLPYSKYIELHSKYGFNILVNLPKKLKNRLNRDQLSSKFINLSEDDITTSGAYILSIKEFKCCIASDI